MEHFILHSIKYNFEIKGLYRDNWAEFGNILIRKELMRNYNRIQIEDIVLKWQDVVTLLLQVILQINWGR